MTDYYIFKERNDPRYKDIQDTVRKNKSLVVNSFSIAGESVSGMFSAFALLTFLRLNIVNKTYHPHLFHYCVGVSVGTIITGMLLNTCFLYEEIGTDVALEYIDAIFEAFNFDFLRNIFLDFGNGKPFCIYKFNPFTLIKNLYNDGSVCVRDALEYFLEGDNIPNFNNKRNYFKTKGYYGWLDKGRLNNVFFICYSAQETTMVSFTGNTKRYVSSMPFVKYEKLSSANFIHAIICSSSIPLIYPVESIDGTHFSTDGASAELNQSFYLQSLINSSYYSSANKMYTPELLFFGIDKSFEEFTIIHNKMNIQHNYENLDIYNQNAVPLIQSFQNLYNWYPRAEYNAGNNVPLMALFLQQPYIPEFSTMNMNDITLTSYDNKLQCIMENIDIVDELFYKQRVPLYLLNKSEFKQNKYYYNNYFKSYKQYEKAYYKYNGITSNIILSSYLFLLNPVETIQLLDEQYDETGDALDLHVCYVDMNCRDMYITNNMLIGFVTNDLTGETKTSLRRITHLGIVIGNILYDIVTRQANTSVSDGTLLAIDENAREAFLGEKQS